MHDHTPRRSLLLTGLSSLLEAASISADLTGYMRALDAALADTQDWSQSRASALSAKNMTVERVRARIKAETGMDASDLTPDNAYQWVSKITKYWMSLSMGAQDGMDYFGIRDDLNALDVAPGMSDDDIAKSKRDLIGDARKSLARIVKLIKSAKDRVGAAWTGARITVSAETSNPLTPGVNAMVRVSPHASPAKGDPSFTLFMDEAGASLADLGDVLDAGDTDFFPSLQPDHKGPRVETDYFNLVAELRKPGSTKKPGKIVRVYTARPIKDRPVYERANQTKTVPTNLFVTSQSGDAEGIAVDFGGGHDTARDVWEIKIDARYLTTTLDIGRLQHYQTYHPSGKVPIQAIHRL